MSESRHIGGVASDSALKLESLERLFKGVRAVSLAELVGLLAWHALDKSVDTETVKLFIYSLMLGQVAGTYGVSAVGEVILKSTSSKGQKS